MSRPAWIGAVDGTGQVLLALFLLLSATTALRLWRARRHRCRAEARERLRSVATWWALLALAGGVVVAGPWAATAVGAVLALLLLGESLSLVRRWSPAGLTPWRSLVAGGLALAAPGFLVATAWIPAPGASSGARMGWLLATLVLSGINDSAQAWWGRRLGHRRLAPVISPGKTWAGLAGGVLTTALVAVWVLPLLTSVGRDAWVVGVPAGAPAVRRGPGAVGPVAGLYVVPPHLVAGGLGALLAVGGLLGDLVVSGVKRRAGVKDSGTLLPGQGGLLDRFDSLMVTAALMAWVGWS